MTSTSLRQVYAGHKDLLATVDLRSFDHVPGSSEWPGAFLLPPTVEYETLAGSQLQFTVPIVVLVSAVVSKRQLDLLDYMDDQGPKSIPLAFHQNPSLGLSGVSASIQVARPLNLEEQAAYQAFGALLESSVLLS